MKNKNEKLTFPCQNLKHIMCAGMLSHFSHVQPFVTPWTVAQQAPLSMGFSRQEYWNGLPCPPAETLPNPGIKPASPTSPALASRFWEKPPGKPQAKQAGQRLLLSREFPCSWLWEYPQLKAPAGTAAKGSDWNRVFLQV